MVRYRVLSVEEECRLTVDSADQGYVFTSGDNLVSIYWNLESSDRLVISVQLSN